jgi:hypothetical protein
MPQMPLHPTGRRESNCACHSGSVLRALLYVARVAFGYRSTWDAPLVELSRVTRLFPGSIVALASGNLRTGLAIACEIKGPPFAGVTLRGNRGLTR